MADKSVADQLRERGVKGANVLVQMAERGQLLALKCEMPAVLLLPGTSARSIRFRRRA